MDLHPLLNSGEIARQHSMQVFVGRFGSPRQQHLAKGWIGLHKNSQYPNERLPTGACGVISNGSSEWMPANCENSGKFFGPFVECTSIHAEHDVPIVQCEQLRVLIDQCTFYITRICFDFFRQSQLQVIG